MYDTDEPISEKTATFLEAVDYYDGRANTSKIRKYTGFNRNSTTYYFRKLEDEGLIDIEKEGESVNSQRIAVLRPEGRKVLEVNPVEEDDDRIDFDETELDRLSEDIQSVSDDVDTLRNKINVVLSESDSTEHVDELREDLLLVRQSVRSIESELEETQEFIGDWTETGQLYLLAIRNILEENGVDFESYIQELRESE